MDLGYLNELVTEESCDQITKIVKSQKTSISMKNKETFDMLHKQHIEGVKLIKTPKPLNEVFFFKDGFYHSIYDQSINKVIIKKL